MSELTPKVSELRPKVSELPAPPLHPLQVSQLHPKVSELRPKVSDHHPSALQLSPRHHLSERTHPPAPSCNAPAPPTSAKTRPPFRAESPAASAPNTAPPYCPPNARAPCRCRASSPFAHPDATAPAAPFSPTPKKASSSIATTPAARSATTSFTPFTTPAVALTTNRLHLSSTTASVIKSLLFGITLNPAPVRLRPSPPRDPAAAPARAHHLPQHRPPPVSSTRTGAAGPVPHHAGSPPSPWPPSPLATVRAGHPQPKLGFTHNLEKV